MSASAFGPPSTPLTVLATTDLPFRGEYWDRLVQIFEPDRIVTVDPTDADRIAEVLETADIAVLGKDLDQRHIAAPCLKWVHVNISGMTMSALPGVFERGLVVTGAAGRSAPALAEHAFRDMLVLTSNFLAFNEAQKRRQWGGITGSSDCAHSTAAPSVSLAWVPRAWRSPPVPRLSE